MFLPVLSHMNLIRIDTSHLSRNILILSSHSHLRVSSLPAFRLNFFCIYFHHACCMPCLSHPPWFDHSSNIWWRVQIMEHIISQRSQPPVTSSPQHPKSLLSIPQVAVISRTHIPFEHNRSTASNPDWRLWVSSVLCQEYWDNPVAPAAI
jgi:hypothetical protein